jgi:TatD DNase family protein
MLIDSHCHLDAKRFDDDRAAMIGRAREAGVQRMVTIGCDVANSVRALGLAATHPDIFATAGVHPHEAAEAQEGFIGDLRRLSAHRKCVAIGECGLDYYYDHSPREVQQRVFAAQIALARELDLPLVIHVRDAWDDCLRLLEEGLQGRDSTRAPGVIHCFSGTLAQAEASLELGFFISIPGIVTFSKPGELPEVARRVPLDRLLVETDSPYLAPKPYRGKRNEPAYVAHVAEKVAELREASVADIIDATGRNAQTLFGGLGA